MKINSWVCEILLDKECLMYKKKFNYISLKFLGKSPKLNSCGLAS